MINKDSKFYFDPMIKIEQEWENKLNFLHPFFPDYKYIITDIEIVNTLLNYNKDITLIDNLLKNNWKDIKKFLYDIKFLIENNIIFEKNYKYNNTLSINEITYYRNNIIFLEDYFKTDWLKLQKELKNKKIAILWVWWSWTALIQHFLWSWIWEIRVIDNDIIELWNIHRQFFYETDDIWKFKVNVMKKFIKKRNPFIKVKSFNKELNEETKDEIKDFVKWVDLFINAGDWPQIYWLLSLIQEICFDIDIPFCWCSSSYWHIIPLVIPWKTSCIECFTKFFWKNKESRKPTFTSWNMKIFNWFNNTCVTYYQLTERNAFVAREIVKFLLFPDSCELTNAFYSPKYLGIKKFLPIQENCDSCNKTSS